jgi:OmpA-OmpF porin, OOP family
LPSAVVSAPSDGLFDTKSATLPRNGTPYLRQLRQLVTGAERLTCTGHTDNRGTPQANHTLGLAHAKAVCAFLTRNTKTKTRATSQGETHPRAPNTTAPGQARNRYVSIDVHY